jgi:hypothetical protein
MAQNPVIGGNMQLVVLLHNLRYERQLTDLSLVLFCDQATFDDNMHFLTIMLK